VPAGLFVVRRRQAGGRQIALVNPQVLHEPRYLQRITGKLAGGQAGAGLGNRQGRINLVPPPTLGPASTRDDQRIVGSTG